MNREVRQHFEVLVIGGGPAGMAAAARAAECGVRVGIVDDNFRLGGKIWGGGTDDLKKAEGYAYALKKFALKIITRLLSQ
jgi:NADPH-dependent 2,4-dienoyl-CoA reductase/sulfur reductase-like enzyme